MRLAVEIDKARSTIWTASEILQPVVLRYGLAHTAVEKEDRKKGGSLFLVLVVGEVHVHAIRLVLKAITATARNVTI